MDAVTKHIKSLDTQLFQCFVMPSLCIDLKQAGLTKETIYTWRMADKAATLFTTVFDLDNYYKDSIPHLEEVVKPMVVPAYQVKDIEKAIQSYTFDRQGKYYTLRVAHIHVSAERMPDVFALAFLQMINDRMITITEANKLIENN